MNKEMQGYHTLHLPHNKPIIDSPETNVNENT